MYNSRWTCLACLVYSYFCQPGCNNHPNLPPWVMHLASNNPPYLQLQLDMPGILCLVYPYFCQPGKVDNNTITTPPHSPIHGLFMPLANNNPPYLQLQLDMPGILCLVYLYFCQPGKVDNNTITTPPHSPIHGLFMPLANNNPPFLQLQLDMPGILCLVYLYFCQPGKVDNNTIETLRFLSLNKLKVSLVTICAII